MAAPIGAVIIILKTANVSICFPKTIPSLFPKYRALSRARAPMAACKKRGTAPLHKIVRSFKTFSSLWIYYTIQSKHLTLSKQQILDTSRLKFPDQNFRFDENDRKFSNWVEMGKGQT